MDNIEIAQVFSEIADILEIREENPFRVEAYRKAAQVIESLPQDIVEIYKEGRLDEIPGIGSSLKEKIEELIQRGFLKELEKLEKKVPQGVVKMLAIEGIGPKITKLVYEKFKVKSIDDLEKLVKSHKLLKLKGFKVKSEENILREIKLYRQRSNRFPLGRVYLLAHEILDELKELKEIDQYSLAGSVRRMKETIGDLDILVTSKKPEKVMDFFTSLPQVKELKAKGRTKSRVILREGVEADLRVVAPSSFGAALHYFTGSKAHNIRIRKMGIERGLKINEYGVYKRVKSDPAKPGHPEGGRRLSEGSYRRRIGGETEKEVFAAVGLPWIPPELREDKGEIEAALRGELPELVELKDLKGDLHLHTNWSDGAGTIEEMAFEAQKRGYEYIAITDHTPTVGITHGLGASRVLAQLKEIKKLNKKFKNFKILAGIEVDIRSDGRLDLPDDVLRQLDLVIASVHTSFRQEEKKMTLRVLKAIRNPYVHIIGHPTGRIIGRREPYRIDMKRIMDEAKKTGTILEANSFWDRLDLRDVHCRLAKDKGVKVAISTDAHNKMELEIIKFGVAQARRGWLEKKDVVNTSSLEDLRRFLKKRIRN